VDHDYYASVDRANPRRVLRGLEVFRITGKPFSAYRKNAPATRNFDVLKVGLELPKDELADRIRSRVDHMIADGLVEEARSLLPYRHLPALQTVGYREMFEHFDGVISLDETIERIKRHTIQFAKRQLTWWRKQPDVHWHDPGQRHDIVSHIEAWLDSSGDTRS
jgi:tRNA dimethylallyltransferase